jgi:glycosyltransferase involved in cell wall biosynthesis
LKLAIVSLSIYPFSFGIGGIEMHAYYLAKYLSKNHEVLLLSQSKKENGYLNYYRLTYCLIRVPKIFFLRDFVFLSKVFSILAKFKPEIVLIDSVAVGYVGLFARLLFKVPYIIVLHGVEIELMTKSPLRLFYKLELDLSKYIVAISDKLAKLISKYIGINEKKIFIIPVGFDPQEIKNAKCSKLKIPSDSPKTIIFMGRLVPEKDPINLLTAIKILSKKRRDFKLIVIGDGPLLSICKNYCSRLGIEELVYFLGERDHKEALSILSNADILVLPSKSEGLPTVIIEAMSFGIPVIATKVGWIEDVIKDGFNGLLVSPRSSIALANAIESLFENRELCRRLSENALLVAKNYSWEIISLSFEKLLLSSIK